jgi:pyrroloquinoline-quinone synthase
MSETGRRAIVTSSRSYCAPPNAVTGTSTPFTSGWIPGNSTQLTCGPGWPTGGITKKNLPQKDAAIIANCPLPEIRRRWLPRITYHDGTTDGGGGCARWLLLDDAVGLSRAEVTDERHVLPGVRFAVDSYITFARTRPWVEGVASSLTELFAPQAMSTRTAALRRHYSWLDHEALQYFDARIPRAREECADALDIVLMHCTSRDSQDAAVRALEFKTEVLWSMLDAIEHSRSALR